MEQRAYPCEHRGEGQWIVKWTRTEMGSSELEAFRLEKDVHAATKNHI